jgi:hypothetical protein
VKSATVESAAPLSTREHARDDSGIEALRHRDLACSLKLGIRVARYRLRLLLQEFDVPPGETVLGRSPECHVTIDDPLVSREHAKIHNHGDRVVLEDLGSRNGSKVNGEPLHGSIELNDGDRIRIGNQEILFSRVLQPKRPGRPTGSLRNCRNCHAPYIAEAPSCPHCGHVPGNEETLSGAMRAAPPAGPGQQLDRQTWSLQMQVELLEKALSMGRLPDADRVLKTISGQLDERLTEANPIEAGQLDPVFAGALRLSANRGDGQWVAWVLTTLRRLERLPNPQLVTQLAQLPPIILDETSAPLEQFVAFWNTRQDELEGPAMHALANLSSLRDEVAARRAHVQARG